tara:strand:- start:308 stop:472 length:165 start_codon:yes stop_codon:yes gene_type:complete
LIDSLIVALSDKDLLKLREDNKSAKETDSDFGEENEDEYDSATLTESLAGSEAL